MSCAMALTLALLEMLSVWLLLLLCRRPAVINHCRCFLGWVLGALVGQLSELLAPRRTPPGHSIRHPVGVDWEGLEGHGRPVFLFLLVLV